MKPVEPCLCGDPGCGSCFPGARPEPGGDEVVLVELPGTGEVIQTRYGELPDYGDRYSWAMEGPPSELEGEIPFFRLYSDALGTPVEKFPDFSLTVDVTPFPNNEAALLTEILLVCEGSVEGHSVEGVFIEPGLAFEAARKLAEKLDFIRSKNQVNIDRGEIAIWSSTWKAGEPNRLIGFVSIERHLIRRSL